MYDSDISGHGVKDSANHILLNNSSQVHHVVVDDDLEGPKQQIYNNANLNENIVRRKPSKTQQPPRLSDRKKTPA